jgi:hypothetical protein
MPKKQTMMVANVTPTATIDLDMTRMMFNRLDDIHRPKKAKPCRYSEKMG